MYTSSQSSHSRDGPGADGLQETHNNPYVDPEPEAEGESEPVASEDHTLFRKIARVSLHNLFAPCMYKVPSSAGAEQLLESFHLVVGRPFACPRGHPIKFGTLQNYGTYCPCCLKNLKSTDAVWWCKCSSICVQCGAEGAMHIIERCTDYDMPPSVLLRIPMS